jgi:hypothetical protein
MQINLTILLFNILLLVSATAQCLLTGIEKRSSWRVIKF